MTATRLGALEVGADRLSELDGGHPVVSFARSEVLSVRVATGFQSERPLLEGLISAIVLLGGLAAAGITVYWLINGGKLSSATPTAAVVLPFLGSAMLVRVFRRAIVLELELVSGSRRLLAGKGVTAAQVESALRGAGWL